MNKYFFYILFLISINACSQPNSSSLNADAFEKGIMEANIQILDVRTAEEYNSGHLKNALQANFNNPKEFNDRVVHLDKNKAVYIYCLSGVRSANALSMLNQQGFTKIYHLKGGINAWKISNKPVEGLVNKTQITLEEYNTVIKTDSLVLVDFGANWCPPCKKMEPTIATLLKDIPQLKLYKIDGGINTNLMQTMEVEALPVFIIYKNGKLVWKKQGIVSLAEFKKEIL